jgi:hypothetical protein
MKLAERMSEALLGTRMSRLIFWIVMIGIVMPVVALILSLFLSLLLGLILMAISALLGVDIDLPPVVILAISFILAVLFVIELWKPFSNKKPESKASKP